MIKFPEERSQLRLKRLERAFRPGLGGRKQIRKQYSWKKELYE